MSYITPDGFIYLLEGVPFDETFQHTLYFANASAQYSYFSSKIKYRFNAQSYQRVRRGYCRIQQRADRMYGCNYMMFQNQSYGDKWFYAFVSEVIYINDSVSEVRYDIDPMQTWFFDYTLNPCFIEREHSYTDSIGENLVPEGFETGDYMMTTVAGDSALIPQGMSIVIASTAGYMSDQDHTIVDYDGGRWYAGIWSGIRYWSFSTSADANDFITALVGAGKKDAIQFVFLAPTSFFTLATNTEPYEHSVAYDKPYTSIDGYVPKNNKLFTYPYQFLMVDTGGNAATFNWEYFSGSTATLKLQGSVVDTGQYMIYPMNYKGQTNNVNEAIIDRCGVQCAWNADAYKAWMAQNQYTLAAQERVIERNSITANMRAGFNTGAGLGGMLNAGTTGASVPSATGYGGSGGSVNELGQLGLPGGGVQVVRQPQSASLDVPNSQFLSGIFQREEAKAQYANAKDLLQATKLTASIKPNIVSGSSTNGIRIGTGVWRPRTYNAHIRREFAEIIDGYFSRYGYATHKVKVPNRNARPHWTFTKTVDCSIKGNIPNVDSNAICSIYNSGITFWRNASEVGNYTLDNSPT